MTISNRASNESTIHQDENENLNFCNSATFSSNGNNSASCADGLSEELSTEHLRPVSNVITSNTVSISINEYKRLCQASIDLIRANRTIDKLNDKLRKKDNDIQKLKEEKLHSSLSPVS